MSGKFADIVAVGCMVLFIALVTVLVFAPCLIVSAGLYAWMAK